MGKKLTDGEKRRRKSARQRERRAEKKRLAEEAEAAAPEAQQGVTVEDIIGDPERVGKALAGAEPGETIRIRPVQAEDKDVELTPEFQRAVNVTMELLDQFIIYERHKPEEAVIQCFPAYMHFKKADIDAEILARYSSGVESGFTGSLEDLQLIGWGIDDALSILKIRTDKTFPQPGPGQGPLNELQFEALSVVAFIETAYFYRWTEDDILRGFIQVSSRHAISAGSPPKSRFRVSIPVKVFAKKFIHVLSREGVDDMAEALIADETVKFETYDMYLLRWREADLI